MAKKNKVDKNAPTYQKKKYTRMSRLFFVGEFISVFTPFIIVGLVNFDKYFTSVNGTRVSIAFVLSAAIMGLATWLVAEKKFENSFITLIIGWATIDGIFFLLGELISDIAVIMLFGLIGILGAFGLDIASKSAKEKANKIQEAINQAEKDNLVEAYKEELIEKEENKKESKKIKIKVKNK